MAGANTRDVVGIVISLIVIAVIMPLGLGLISAAGTQSVTINGTGVALDTVVDPAVITLLTILLPILAVIAVIMYFLPKGNN
ncbi:hypothetical protein ES702_06957 [subsurface metagenome]